MAGLSITGQMKVSTLQEGFLMEFGLTLRVYDGRSFADPTQTLAQVRKKKGSGKALSVAKNMKVGNLEDKIEEEFGLKVQVAGSDDSYLCDNNLTLNAAQQEDEKKIARKERKAARQDEASDDGDQDDGDDGDDDDGGDTSLVHMSNYYNLRFGYCNSDSEGDFIDNINGALNIYVATGADDDQNEYLLLYYNNKFLALADRSIHDNLEDLAKSLNTIFSEEIAKGLIQSGYDNDPDGIIDHAPDYEDHYFDTRDDDDVDGFIPCYFVVASVTYNCNCKVDIKSGAIIYEDEKVNNFSDFYGYLDEDETYAIGVVDYKNV
jgi:hypothetical protein